MGIKELKSLMIRWATKSFSKKLALMGPTYSLGPINPTRWVQFIICLFPIPKYMVPFHFPRCCLFFFNDYSPSSNPQVPETLQFCTHYLYQNQLISNNHKNSKAILSPKSTSFLFFSQNFSFSTFNFRNAFKA